MHRPSVFRRHRRHRVEYGRRKIILHVRDAFLGLARRSLYLGWWGPHMSSRLSSTQSEPLDLHKVAAELDAKIATLPEWVIQLFRQRAMTAQLIAAQQQPLPVFDDRLPALLRPQA